MKIQIPNPCQENWQMMLPQEKGRFCENCQKLVVDFTKMNDAEIIIFFEKNSHKTTCGHIGVKQLESLNQGKFYIDKHKTWYYKTYQKTILFFSSVIYIAFVAPKSVFAQEKPKQEKNFVEANEVIQHNPNEVDLSNVQKLNTKNISIKGIVVDEIGKEPLPGVTISIKNTKIGTLTNLDGEFLLKNCQENDILVIVYIGYEEREMLVSEILKNKPKNGEYNFFLTESKTIDGEACVYHYKKPNIFKRFWRGIKGVFRGKNQ